MIICVLSDGINHFNSRPHEEVDAERGQAGRANDYFNSRPHEEVDLASRDAAAASRGISTHDLTKRSTTLIIAIIAMINISTHDLTKRSTRQNMEPLRMEKIFQLTTSRRGRLLVDLDCGDLAEYFNSRPHEEVDRTFPSGKVLDTIFQLTTSRRGRREIYDALNVKLEFQLTTSRRGRPGYGANAGSVQGYFNSRPHEEVDNGMAADYIFSRYFNSRPHEEVDEHPLKNF